MVLHVTLLLLDLEEFDPFLGAYPYEHLSKWVSLTNHITEDLVSRYFSLVPRSFLFGKGLRPPHHLRT